MGNHADWVRMETETTNLMNFVAVVKQGLQYGLADLSLQLIDMELWHQPSVVVIDANSEAWMLRCVVQNPATRQIKETRTRFQADIGDTDVESVRPMVVDIVENLRKAFYG